MVDIDKLLKETVKKGEVKIGSKETLQVINDGSAKLVVISRNCPNSSKIKKNAEDKKIPVYSYKSNAVDLGITCGKPFSVAAFAVLDDGGTNVTKLV